MTLPNVITGFLHLSGSEVILSDVSVLCYFYVRKLQRLHSRQKNRMCWPKSRRSSSGSCSSSGIKRATSLLRWVYTSWIPFKTCLMTINILAPFWTSAGDWRYKREADAGPQSHQDAVSWSGDKDGREGWAQVNSGLPRCWEEGSRRYVARRRMSASFWEFMTSKIVKCSDEGYIACLFITSFSLSAAMHVITAESQSRTMRCMHLWSCMAETPAWFCSGLYS